MTCCRGKPAQLSFAPDVARVTSGCPKLARSWSALRPRGPTSPAVAVFFWSGHHRKSAVISMASLRERVEQFLRFLKIAHVEAFGEPVVDRGEEIAGLLALVPPEAGETHCGTQLEYFCVLPSRDGKCIKKAGLCRKAIVGEQLQITTQPNGLA